MTDPTKAMLLILTTTNPPMSEDEAKAAITRVPSDVLAYAVRYKETCIRLVQDLKEGRV